MVCTSANEAKMTFKPMLAPTDSPKTSTLKFPLMVSHKLDGIRATVQGGILLSRNLKPIPNKHVQKRFLNLVEGLDGELISGNVTDTDVFRNTTSVVMSDDNPADAVSFHVFDRFIPNFPEQPFEERYFGLAQAIRAKNYKNVVLVEHDYVSNEEELLKFEAAALEIGHEGVMLRDPDGPYKQGRATAKQGWIFKLKRFDNSEAEILDVHELMRNENEAKTNALGRTERSTAKAGLVPGGTMGKLSVRDIHTGVEFQVGGAFSADLRKQIWDNRLSYPGLVIRYKYFAVGSKDKPRFPIFEGFRDKRDM